MNLSDALKANGKARRTEWEPGVYIHFGIKDREYFYTHTDAIWDWKYCHASILFSDWESMKEPCKHEPNGLNLDLPGIVFSCSKCPANIRPIGWEEV